MGADPTWCAVCQYNIEMDEFVISDQLKRDFHEWVRRFGEWIEWDTDTLAVGWEIKMKRHNREGDLLSKRLQEELGEAYEIEFIPANTIEEGHF